MPQTKLYPLTNYPEKGVRSDTSRLVVMELDDASHNNKITILLLNLKSPQSR